MYHMLTINQQRQIQLIEQRALNYFIQDLLGICLEKDKNTNEFKRLALLTEVSM